MMDETSMSCPDCGMDMRDMPDMGEGAVDEMSAATRNALPDSDFLYIDPKGGRHFPVHDAKHVRLAIQMMSRSKLSPEIKAKMRAKLKRLASKHGIEMSESTSQTKQLIEREESPVQILEGYSDGYLRAKFLVTTVDVSNRNGRTYPRALAERETSTRFEGRVLGQSKHPQSEPDILDQFIVWESALLEGDNEFFVAKIIPTQKGKDFTEIARAGATVSSSRRGAGELREGTDKNGKKTKIVMSETYRLLGIDVLYPGVQSNASSMHTIHFEAVQDQENANMNELTAEQLREEREDLVTEIETAATKPLEEKIAALESDVTAKDATIATLTTEKEQANVLAQEKDAKLTEADAQVKTLNEKVVELTTQVESVTKSLDEATARVNALTETITAQKHLLEKVKGEKAAWLILDELKSVTSVAEVDAKYDSAKARCDALIENANVASGKAVTESNENDELNKDKKTDAKQKPGIDPKAKLVARMNGFQIN